MSFIHSHGTLPHPPLISSSRKHTTFWGCKKGPFRELYIIARTFFATCLHENSNTWIVFNRACISQSREQKCSEQCYFPSLTCPLLSLFSCEVYVSAFPYIKYQKKNLSAFNFFPPSFCRFILHSCALPELGSLWVCRDSWVGCVLFSFYSLYTQINIKILC